MSTGRTAAVSAKASLEPGQLLEKSPFLTRKGSIFHILSLSFIIGHSHPEGLWRPKKRQLLRHAIAGPALIKPSAGKPYIHYASLPDHLMDLPGSDNSASMMKHAFISVTNVDDLLDNTLLIPLMARRVLKKRGTDLRLPREKSLDYQIEESLTGLGIASLTEWDALVFVYRHQASLVSADEIAQFLGYSKIAVGDALNNLIALQLICRSRASHGVCLYQFEWPGAAHTLQRSFRQLHTMTENAPGRAILINKLRHLAPSCLS
jgi:hypothetical protein